jgi:hypothetical protein
MMRIKRKDIMFNLKRPDEELRRLEEALDRAIMDLGNYPSHSKEYAAIATSVRVLAEANTVDQTAYKKPSVSPETMATIGANLLGILMVLNYERAHVLTSKAMSMLHRIKM